MTTLLLYDVDTRQPVKALRALRGCFGGSLRWAKLEVFDQVRTGYGIELQGSEDDASALRAGGWLVRVDAAEAKGEK